MIKKLFVLSGGGARGFAHLGVVKALQECDIYPEEIAGTSAGAIAGAFLANGFSPDEIEEMFVHHLKSNWLTWTSYKIGLISIKKIQEFLESNLRHKTFEKLEFPLYITATNFMNGKQQILNQGNLIEAIIASCSIPVLFPPVIIDGIPYVDGGLSSNLPVEPFVHHMHEIVGVYVNPVIEYQSDESVLQVMDRAVHLGFREKVSRAAEKCNIYIEPLGLQQFGLFEVQKIKEIVETGYDFTKELLEARQSDKHEKEIF